MTEKLDVLVVGAGISGIGAGYHLQNKCPDAKFVILEGRDKIGGTWDLFKYPGIRSDSDMYTLGFNFKPWKEQEAIADAPSILKYLNETVEEFNLNAFLDNLGSLGRSTQQAFGTVRDIFSGFGNMFGLGSIKPDIDVDNDLGYYSVNRRP